MTYNLSLANKISNGLIKNNHHVINIDYRSKVESTKFILNNFLVKSNIDDEIIKIVDNYKPHLILLGHNNILIEKQFIKLKIFTIPKLL